MPELTSRQKVRAAVIAVLIITFSFFRDHLFRSVNEQLRLNYYGEEHYDYSFLSPWLSVMTDEHLMRLKFILTAVSVFVFTLLCILWVRSLFKNRNYPLYVAIAYGCVFVLGLLIFGIGKILAQEDVCYTIARSILEFIQSPIMILILTAIFWYDSKLNHTRDHQEH